MKPTTYVKLFGHLKDAHSLEVLLSVYIQSNKPYIDTLRSITDASDMLALSRINEYEVELRVADECIQKWKAENGEKL